MIAVTRLAAPAVEPIGWADIQPWTSARDDEQTLLQELIIDCREEIEDYLGRALIQQQLAATWDCSDLLTRDGTLTRTLAIPRPPLISVQSFMVTDDAGVSSVVAPALYQVIQGHNGRIRLTAGYQWPCLREHGAVTVTFTAGYGPDPSSVPRRIKLALKEMVTYYRQHRGEGFIMARPVAGHEVGDGAVRYAPRLRRVYEALSRYRVEGWAR